MVTDFFLATACVLGGAALGEAVAVGAANAGADKAKRDAAITAVFAKQFMVFTPISAHFPVAPDPFRTLV